MAGNENSQRFPNGEEPSELSINDFGEVAKSWWVERIEDPQKWQSTARRDFANCVLPISVRLGHMAKHIDQDIVPYLRDNDLALDEINDFRKQVLAMQNILHINANYLLNPSTPPDGIDEELSKLWKTDRSRYEDAVFQRLKKQLLRFKEIDDGYGALVIGLEEYVSLDTIQTNKGYRILGGMEPLQFRATSLMASCDGGREPDCYPYHKRP